jgi:hypothetical protein
VACGMQVIMQHAVERAASNKGEGTISKVHCLSIRCRFRS